MKKILLTAINSKYIHSNPAVYSLRAFALDYLRKNEIEDPAFSQIEIAEYTINQRAEDIIADIYKRKADIIAISCYIWNREMTEELLDELPQIIPKCDVWLGGPEAACDAGSFLDRHSNVKLIMTGEGEETFAELVSFYEKKELTEISGLVLRSSETPARPLLDMNELPFFYKEWEGVPGIGPFKNRIIYYESSRGCPYRCSYCLSSIDKSTRFKNAEMVFGELKFFLDRKVPQVKFIDRTFNCNPKRAEQIWRFILENDNGVTNFHFEIAADILTEKQLEIMSKMRPGLIQLEIGVQTTNVRTLEAIRRSTDMKKLQDNVETVKKYGNIHQHLDLIAGLPYEDIASFEKSFNDVFAMQPDQLQLGFLKVLKGTEISDTAERYKIVSRKRAPYEVVATHAISYEDILRLKKIEEVVEIYYNSGQFTKILPVLTDEFDGPFEFFDSLSSYFEEKGYFLNQPARIFRYNILLDFACSISPGKADIYRELLTCDLYLRENMKSRPDFAKDMGPYKERIRELRQKYNCGTRAKHIEVFSYPVFKDKTELYSEINNAAGLYSELNDSALLQKTKEQNDSGADGCKPHCESFSGPFFVLFDYEKRDPLGGNAAIQVIKRM